MTSHSSESMTCAEFEALLTDYLEAHALPAAQRAAADAHVAGCVDCAALLSDVRMIVRDAGELPALAPGRDLWRGIEQRIEAPIVAIGVHTPDERREAYGVTDGDERRKAYGVTDGDERRKAYGDRGAWSVRRLAIAASVLVAVTAGITYTLTKRQADLAVTPDSARLSPSVASPLVSSASNRPSAEQSFDLEIASIRKVADARRAELDTATIRIVEKNLKLIDAAIAESKAALRTDPASAFLMDQLTHAYDAKLRFLRGLATLPARS